jgi:excisionase family DNA binding protein
MTPQLWTVAQVCEYLNAPRTRVNELLDEGEMLWFHIGSRRMVPVPEVERFVNRALAETRRAFETRAVWRNNGA